LIRVRRTDKPRTIGIRFRPYYPAFKHPEDWRLAASEPSPYDERRAVQLVADAEADHHERHWRHEHPWCVLCWQRRADTEMRVRGEDPDWLLIQRTRDELHDLCGEDGPDPAVLLAVQEFFYAHDGIIGADDVAALAESTGATVDQIRAVAVWGDAAVARECDRIEAQRVTTARAARHLLLHRNPPVDDFDPDADDAGGFDAEYLDREQINDLPAPEPLIEGVLSRHTYDLLIGRDGTLKSFLALDWALCLATGKPWQGREVEQSRVLFIAGEGAYGLPARIEAWEHAWGKKVDPKWFTARRSAVNLFKAGAAFDDLLGRVQAGEYGLVIVDTLRRASGGADANGSDMGVVIDRIEKIKRATDDGSVLVIAHTGKNDEDARGFSAIEDDADTVWKATRTDRGRLALKCTKMKDGPDGTVIDLKPLPVLDSLVLEAARPTTPEDEDTTAAASQILSLLTVAFSETGATRTDLRDACQLSKTSFYRSLNALVMSGQVVNTGTKRSPLYELAQRSSPT
jgi:hypothetical protein